jgi:hypothetical protein
MDKYRRISKSSSQNFEIGQIGAYRVIIRTLAEDGKNVRGGKP